MKSFYAESNKLDDDSILKSLKKDFQQMKPIKKMPFLRVLLFCRKNYRKLILKSKSSINKELDLRKFIYRQRL